MIPIENLLAFMLTSLVIIVIPGPSVLFVIGRAIALGRRAGVLSVVGNALGTIPAIIAVAFGVGAIVASSVVAFTVIKIVGALYLIYLGIQQWRAPVQAGPEATVRVAPMSARRRFLTGFLTNATNPKGIIFMVAVLPQFMTTSRPLAPQLAILAVTMLAVDTTVMHSYAAGASALRGLMRSARAMRNQNRVFGGLLMAVGTGLFFVQRSGEA